MINDVETAGITALLSRVTAVHRHNQSVVVKDSPRARGPSPETIRAARVNAGITPSDAASLVHCTRRVWYLWESGERRMHPAFWELWHLKIAKQSTRNPT